MIFMPVITSYVLIYMYMYLPGVSQYLDELDAPNGIDEEAEFKPREER